VAQIVDKNYRLLILYPVQLAHVKLLAPVAGPEEFASPSGFMKIHLVQSLVHRLWSWACENCRGGAGVNVIPES